jgi:hypothetical protein
MPAKRTRQPKSGRPVMPTGYGVPRSRKGLLPFSHFERLFKKNRNYFLATVAAGPRPHVMPVWGVWHDGRFYFSTGGDSRKARNLARNKRCVITSEDGAEPTILEGIAERVKDASALKGAAPVYRSKYDWELTLDMGNVYQVTPVKAFAFKEAAAQFGKTATRWTF